MMNQPQTHGGKRPGAGRKARKDERKSLIVRVALTDHEHLQVLTLTPDERRKALIAAINGPSRKGDFVMNHCIYCGCAYVVRSKHSTSTIKTDSIVKDH